MNASIGGELPDVCISEDAKLEESRKTLQFVHTALDKENISYYKEKLCQSYIAQPVHQ